MFFFPFFYLVNFFYRLTSPLVTLGASQKECLSCGSLPPALTEGTPAAEFKDLSPRATRSGKMCLRVSFPEPLTLCLHSLYYALSLPDTNYTLCFFFLSFLFCFWPHGVSFQILVSPPGTELKQALSREIMES